jgi:uncharacterized protein (TIGR02147 family)
MTNPTVMEELQQTYRDLLRDILQRRSARNPAYSLRLMARQIGVSAATLSGVLRSKKNLSFIKAQSIAGALKLGRKETEIFLLLVQIEHTNDPGLKFDLMKKLHALGGGNKASHISVEQFRVVSDWYHYAILSLADVPSFNFTKDAIPLVARTLGITVVEAHNAVRRLETLEMIEWLNGRCFSREKNFLVQAKTPEPALRLHHKQLLQKAIDSIVNQSPNEKYMASETVAIDSSKLEEFTAITEDYLNKIIDLANSSDAKDHVYQLGVQFFRLTRKDFL